MHVKYTLINNAVNHLGTAPGMVDNQEPRTDNSHPSRSVIMLGGEHSAPVAQLDRVPGYEPGGREFESLRARHFLRPSIYGWPFEYIEFLKTQTM